MHQRLQYAGCCTHGRDQPNALARARGADGQVAGSTQLLKNDAPATAEVESCAIPPVLAARLLLSSNRARALQEGRMSLKGAGY